MQTPNAQRGMVTSPHHLASQAGLDILKAGGTAIEAVIATASTLAAVYPHMTGLGGDAFWLITFPDGRALTIDSCGALAGNATHDFYQTAGHTTIPWRGGYAANTVAGAVASWEAALAESARYQPNLPLPQILESAIHYASTGHIVTSSEAALLAEKSAELAHDRPFNTVFIPTPEGGLRRNPALGRTLTDLARNGLHSFYRGPTADSIIADLHAAGSPLTLADLDAHQAIRGDALKTQTSWGTLFNTAPPTQGAASLLILALFDRLGLAGTAPESYEHLHGLIEATKQAFRYRNRHIDGRPESEALARTLLGDSQALDAMARQISMTQALPWTEQTQWGDTTWMGAVDRSGMAVSMIQSLYFEFGSGVLLPESGLIWQNRGSSFRLTTSGWNTLTPGGKPFHTLNPAAAYLNDGRQMVYGTMGGEGQPQTQAALFSRYVHYGVPLQEAICRPRWLLGRTWGEESTSLKMEPGFDPATLQKLEQTGHFIEMLPGQSSLTGHAGALVRHANGRIEGATDPRSDGSVAAW